MAESGQEKTEAATPRHRQEARKRGTVAKSQDLTGALVMFAMILVLPGAMTSIGLGLLSTTKASFAHIPTNASSGTILGFGFAALHPVLPGMAMILFTIMAVGVASGFGQVGIKMSAEALVPNFQKLNPISGMKRLFSPQLAFEGAKALLKSVVFGYIAYSALAAAWSKINMLGGMAALSSITIVGAVIKAIAWKIVMAWLALAGLDYYFQRSQVEKQLKMTKEEVRREMKESESSPEVKAARARRRRQMKQRMAQAVQSADVVIVNPTHYAVALKYDPETQKAPVVVAKGVDFLAARIREEAKAAKVPIIPNPPLARALYKQCEIGDIVPRELFQAVAEVLAYVFRTIKKVRS